MLCCHIALVIEARGSLMAVMGILKPMPVPSSNLLSWLCWPSAIVARLPGMTAADTPIELATRRKLRREIFMFIPFGLCCYLIPRSLLRESVGSVKCTSLLVIAQQARTIFGTVVAPAARVTRFQP